MSVSGLDRSGQWQVKVKVCPCSAQGEDKIKSGQVSLGTVRTKYD